LTDAALDSKRGKYLHYNVEKEKNGGKGTMNARRGGGGKKRSPKMKVGGKQSPPEENSKGNIHTIAGKWEKSKKKGKKESRAGTGGEPWRIGGRGFGVKENISKNVSKKKGGGWAGEGGKTTGRGVVPNV